LTHGERCAFNSDEVAPRVKGQSGGLSECPEDLEKK